MRAARLLGDQNQPDSKHDDGDCDVDVGHRGLVVGLHSRSISEARRVTEEKRAGPTTRWEWDSDPCEWLCRPPPRLSAIPPARKTLTQRQNSTKAAPCDPQHGREPSVRIPFMERTPGVEPSPPPWNGDALPLRHIRVVLRVKRLPHATQKPPPKQGLCAGRVRGAWPDGRSRSRPRAGSPPSSRTR